MNVLVTSLYSLVVYNMKTLIIKVSTRPTNTVNENKSLKKYKSPVLKTNKKNVTFYLSF